MNETKTTSQHIDDEVNYHLDQLVEQKAGSEEHHNLVESIKELQSLNLKDSELNLEWDLKDRELNLREKELKLKEEELKSKDKELGLKAKEIEKKSEEIKNRDKWQTVGTIVNAGVTLISLVGSWTMLWKTTNLGFKFEETGSIGGNTTRQSFNIRDNYIKRYL